MNKPLTFVALCLGSAVVGGFIAVRVLGHPSTLQAASAPSGAISAPPVVALPPVSPVGVGQTDRSAHTLAGAPPAPTPVESRDDYDFESLAGPSQKLAHRFDSERRDPGWAPRAMDTVSHELEGQPLFSQLTTVDVDCKATLCRIDGTLSIEALVAAQSNGATWGDVISKLFNAPPWSTEFDNISDSVSIDNQFGQAQVVTYLHRRPQGAISYAGTRS